MTRQRPLATELQQELRALPSVDAVLAAPHTGQLVADFGRDLVTEAIRAVLEHHRHQIRKHGGTAPDEAALIADVAAWLNEIVTPSLLPLINATGVIVHTNLGRAPLSKPALAAVQAVAEGYSNLEYDLPEGQRGSRHVHAADLLTRLTQAEDALVVNNNAAAVLLMLTALCEQREVIISRGQLVEIGGGFRVPDVMAQSGARLVEVGTTNRTHLRDYAAAISAETAAILVAHHSNFKIVGFTSEPSLAELAALAHEHDLPLLYDQGSGALLDTARYGLASEPTVQDALAAGVDVVAFSGDKLLGGPQAGILCGRADLLAQLRTHPLARAVRADKLCLAGLSATLAHYLTGDAERQVPVWWMMSRSPEELEARAKEWMAALGEHGIAATVVPGESTVGGGSLPGTTLPTYLLAIEHPAPDNLAQALRASRPPIVGRIVDDRFVVDPRTVLPEQAPLLLRAVTTVMRGT